MRSPGSDLRNQHSHVVLNLSDAVRDALRENELHDALLLLVFAFVVLPLALVSSGRELSSRCPMLVHSWLSRRLEGPSRVVSWLLWKKVTLLGRPCA